MTDSFGFPPLTRIVVSQPPLCHRFSGETIRRAMTPAPSRPPAPLRRRWRRWRSWRRWILVVVCVVLLAVALRDEDSMVSTSLSSFAHLRWGALISAVAAEVASMVALGLMERRILIMGGLRLPVGRSVAIAYASNAFSASLPIIGSGAASAFTYRRLVSQGAAPVLAGWALILSGVVSNAVFVVIICIGGIVSGNVIGVAAGAAGIVLTFLVVWLAALAIRRPPVRARVIRASNLGSFAPNRRDVLRAVYSALRNWAFDLLCLAFSIRAAGVHVPWWGIVLAWAAALRPPPRPRRVSQPYRANA
jgi:putative heme transporter